MTSHHMSKPTHAENGYCRQRFFCSHSRCGQKKISASVRRSASCLCSNVWWKSNHLKQILPCFNLTWGFIGIYFFPEGCRLHSLWTVWRQGNTVYLHTLCMQVMDSYLTSNVVATMSTFSKQWNHSVSRYISDTIILYVAEVLKDSAENITLAQVRPMPNLCYSGTVL